jgi:biopolymer transport protein ExbB
MLNSFVPKQLAAAYLAGAALLFVFLLSPALAQTPSPETVVGLPETVSLLPRDLSPWGMFLHADFFVKLVMVGLVFASLVTWTVFLAKAVELLSVRRQVYRQLRILSEAHSLKEADVGRDEPVSQFFHAAERELALSGNLPADGVKERIALQLARIEAAAGRRISRGMGILASIGATAPFVGLFGTVWGIMNSFIGISKAHTTNLAVVAPGIAEALLATALGLVAAIPAVVIYNVFSRWITGYRALLADATTGIMRLVSRDLDRGTFDHRPTERRRGPVTAAER